MRTVELLLERLEGVLEHDGFHRAFCPAHDDRNTPNLDIKEGDEGQALVICRAGCKTHEVVGALGLEMGDPFLLSPKGRRNGHKKARGKPTHVWEIRDADGELQAEHVRYDPSTSRQLQSPVSSSVI